jgi:hypothetical protein
MYFNNTLPSEIFGRQILKAEGGRIPPKKFSAD